ncbi:hypothetical protein K1719_039435 [Acacia pycnantha]|nr:hypothetical protein K1719_039435 [Acacia pycnantha]
MVASILLYQISLWYAGSVSYRMKSGIKARQEPAPRIQFHGSNPRASSSPNPGMTNREYLDDQDAEEPDDFIISLIAQ